MLQLKPNYLVDWELGQCFLVLFLGVNLKCKSSAPLNSLFDHRSWEKFNIVSLSSFKSVQSFHLHYNDYLKSFFYCKINFSSSGFSLLQHPSSCSQPDRICPLLAWNRSQNDNARSHDHDHDKAKMNTTIKVKL